MLTNEEINEIKVKHLSTLTAPSERTWEDEAWIIGHLKEIVTSYRRDIPRLLEERDTLKAALENEREHSGVIGRANDKLAATIADLKSQVSALTGQVDRLKAELEISNGIIDGQLAHENPPQP